MLASIIIEYSAKKLNKVFDYIIPDNMLPILKVGHKVIVPFASNEVEGFVLKIHNNIEKDIEYKEIIQIPDADFYLNDELLKLGEKMSNDLICNKISCYQAMLPKALRASIKTNINIKYQTLVSLNPNKNIDEYIKTHQRNKKEIELIYLLKEKNTEIKSEINCSSLKKLIENEIVLETKEELNRKVDFLKEEKKEIILTDEQNSAIKEILTTRDQIYLLHGVTGSGKTEVYINLIEQALKSEKTAIVLVPEISLTPQIVARFKSVFNDSVAVLHSSLSEGEKYDEYRRIIKNEVSIVVGARSAIFAPLNNIGLIIIDECQSATYKQDNTPKYNAIEIAIERSKYHNAKIVLGSATPNLEQYARAKKGVFHLVKLNQRISTKMPIIELVDMEKEAKKRNYIISEKLDTEINRSLSRNEQVIILLNRRGFSTFLSCSNCGYVYTCPNCDISLIYHKTSNSFSCHYCGYRVEKSNICPKCHEDAIKDLGLGTEKLTEMLEKKYNTKVLRMDADTTKTKNAHQKLIKEFQSGEYKILVGTQMISKGLNFENASLVGIINADASLAMPDFRSSERTYELLSQTSGRVGRFNIDGKVLIQTYNKDNYVYECVKRNDFDLFFNREMIIRKKLSYPPYYYICNILVTSSDFHSAGDAANKARTFLDNKIKDKAILLGPTVSALARINNKYRFNIMIKYKDINAISSALKELNEIDIKGVNIDISINI